MKPVFIYTENVKNFISTMKQAESRMGYDSLAMVFGRAGRGKTRTALYYATQNDCVYISTLRDWSVLWMYQDILQAMGVMSDNLPKRKKQAFEMILDLMADEPRVVILDEADILGPRLLESVRDLCKMARVPWVLVGEESLPMLMTKDRRVWSRNCASMEFSPMITSDICIFTKEATGLTMPPESADIIQRQTGGDVRLIELIIGMSETIARANNTKEITPEMAGKAIKKVIPEMKKRKQ